MGNNTRIEISIGEQTLTLFNGPDTVKTWPISTAKNGPGEYMDSECTPRGRHVIAEKIGEMFAPNTVLVGRQPTGEIYHPDLRRQHSDRDWILTRILWLKGMEPGINQGGDRDSYHRFIYIHGCPDDVDIGTPGSRGCIRMHNADVIELFDQVEEGTEVLILEG